MLAALLAATAAGAQTVYKSTNPDGSVVYSDRPPADGKIDKVIEFGELPSSAVPPLDVQPLVSSRLAGALPHRAVMMMHTPKGARVVPVLTQPLLEQPQLSEQVDVRAPAPGRAIPPPPPVTLYSATWCGYCRRAKAWLAEHHIAYLNVDIDTPDGRAEFDSKGRGGIPLLTDGTKKLRGFRAEGYDVFFGSR